MQTASPLAPLMAAAAACSLAMMGFVTIIGPFATGAGLAPWQIGATVTAGGLAWVLASGPWGRASDRHGRLAVLRAGLAGFVAAYAALAAVVALAPGWPAAATLAGLMVARAAAGAAYAAVPAAGNALIADLTPPGERPAAMGRLGAAQALGLVAGPGLVALLAGLPPAVVLGLLAAGPAICLVWLGRIAAPVAAPVVEAGPAVGLRRPAVAAFLAMAAVGIAQLATGIAAAQRFALSEAEAIRLAGLALLAVGIALMLAQLAIRRTGLAAPALVAIGGTVAAAGLSAAAIAPQPALFVLAMAVAGAGAGWVFPALSALAADAAGPAGQGRAAGAIARATGLGAMVGPLAGGLAFGLGDAAPFLLAALPFAAVALLAQGRAGAAQRT
jgi:MFS family permease